MSKIGLHKTKEDSNFGLFAFKFLSGRIKHDIFPDKVVASYHLSDKKFQIFYLRHF